MVAMEHKVEMTAFRTQVTAIEGRLSTSERQAEGRATRVQQALMVSGIELKTDTGGSFTKSSQAARCRVSTGQLRSI